LPHGFRQSPPAAERRFATHLNDPLPQLARIHPRPLPIPQRPPIPSSFLFIFLLLFLLIAALLKLLKDLLQRLPAREQPDSVPLVRQGGLEDPPLLLPRLFGLVVVKGEGYVVELVLEELVKLVGEGEVEVERLGRGLSQRGGRVLGEEEGESVREVILANQAA
jgi:hypothetical protein